MLSPYNGVKADGEPGGTTTSEYQHALTPADAYLCQRHLVRPNLADLVASLAGIGDRRAL